MSNQGRHIHLLGICGTAMASLAGMLQLQGHRVTGSDAAAYPPMSHLLAGLGINGYLAVIWFGGHNLSNRPLLLLGVLLMLLGIQVLTTGLIGEMITFKNFRRRDSYSIKEWLE